MDGERPVVLIVDGSDRVRARVATQLARDGFRPLQAASGRAAFQLLEVEPVAAVVMDLRMPDMTGAGMIRAMRARPDTSTMPILVLASADEDAVLEALHAGADDFLAAPVRLPELIARIRAHLRTSLAWSDKVDLAFRTRADLASALGGLSMSGDGHEVARAIVGQLAYGSAYDYIGLLQIGDPGDLEVLATYSRHDGPDAGGRIAETTARYLLARSRDGPWVEVLGQAERAGSANAFGMVGPEIAAMAAIHAGTRMVGMLALGSSAALGAGTPAGKARLLAAAIDHASIIGMVAGPSIAYRGSPDESRSRLRRIVAGEAFHPVFQPVVTLATREIIGFEALTRFADGTPPDVRFAEAAELGLGSDLEAVAIQAALRASERIQAPGWLAVNASPDLVMDEPRMERLLDFAPPRLVLEVTEHARIGDYAVLRAALDRLGDRVQVSVDDAGAGYASLRHILELRPAFVKLDLSIVRGIDGDPVRQALVSGLVYFADRMGSELIAEGVETGEEAAVLHGLGIPYGQGYLFGYPELVG